MKMQRLTQPVTDADVVSGSLDARVVILQYGDFECPHTRASNALIKRLSAEHPGELALVFRHFPLRHIHQNAEQLSRLMKAVAELYRPRYWEAHDAVMSIRRMSVPAAQEALTALGLDLPELERAAPTMATLVQLDADRGQADGVHSTPSFFFNGEPWDGHYDLSTLRQRFELAPERG